MNDLWVWALAGLDASLMPWVTWGAVTVSRLEGVACVLSLWMVWFNLRVNAMAWPLAIASSALYGLLFWRSRLYGEASLQGVFIAVAMWGWWLWLRDERDALAAEDADKVTEQSPTQRLLSLLVVLLAWPALGWLLSRVTDSDVPYADALPTAGSLLGQVLLARKKVENWVCWLAVNLLSMALFAHKALWLTVILYGVFAVLSVVGWRQWLALLRPHPTEAQTSS